MVKLSHNDFAPYRFPCVTPDSFNHLDTDSAASAMAGCCSASRWVARMVDGRPYESLDAILDAAERAWSDMEEPDWIEAFDGHPRIGDPDSLKARYHATLDTASNEQSGTQVADEDTLTELARLNQEYFDRFGFIFIIFASGKSAEEMLAALRRRIDNRREEEQETAAAEQWQITRLRLTRLFADADRHTGHVAGSAGGAAA